MFPFSPFIDNQDPALGTSDDRVQVKYDPYSLVGCVGRGRNSGSSRASTEMVACGRLGTSAASFQQDDGRSRITLCRGGGSSTWAERVRQRRGSVHNAEESHRYEFVVAELRHNRTAP